MEEMNQEKPTMSPFCEAIMDRTEDVHQLKTTRDCAIILCSDGDKLACRIAGSYDQIFNLLLKKMLADKQFCRVMSFAVHAFIVHISEHIFGPQEEQPEDTEKEETAKEIQFN